MSVTYPDHSENNVKYYYGGVNASHNRIGRLMLREDGTGAEEYYYGKMGEVTKVRRTLIVPNQAIATYVTQWKYDSHNRLQEMIYPDEEKITYSYNLGGLLEKVRGYKSYGYDYVNKLGYDKFEQRSYLKYCNGAETYYDYDAARRRLSNLAVYSGKTNKRAIMDNAYSYDAVSNVLSVANNALLPTTGAGGQMRHTYTYDNLYRLATATGTYTGAEQKTAGYELTMAYDNMHRITSKKQVITQKNVQFNGTLNAGYDLTYAYSQEAGKKFQLANVNDLNYRTEGTPNKKTENNHAYSYDKNGNLIYVNTARTKADGTSEQKNDERKLKWDEENRLLAVDDNGFVSNYWYDADGERTVKTSGDGEAIYVNSLFSGGTTQTRKFTLYVSPYLVASQGGKYTKHIYVGSQRIVSKLGDLASYGADPRRIAYAGSETDNITVDYKKKYSAQQQSIKNNYATFEVPYNGKDNNDYVDGQGFCCTPSNSPQGGAQKAARANDNPELYQYYYHSDHLGSSSFITNLDGNVSQHIEYVPYGEVFIEERNNVWNTPYLFNAKELDEETGLYYYGARYYEPRISLWISVDPLAEKYPYISSYVYCANNPVNAVDPDGKKIVFLIRNSDGSVREKLTYSKGNFWHEDGKRYNPGKESLSKTLYKVLASYRKIEASKNSILKNQLKTLENTERIHFVEGSSEGTGSGVSPYPKQDKKDTPTGSQTHFDLSDKRKAELKKSAGVSFTDFDIVTHEMRHQFDNEIGNMKDSEGLESSATNPAEIRAVWNENQGRKVEGSEKRTTYGGKKIDPKKLKSPPNNRQK